MIENKNFALKYLVTPKFTKSTPIHDWYFFPHSFSPNLLDYLLLKLNLNPREINILDPFCGGGTTLLRSKELGINADGVDIMPLSLIITRAKTGMYKFEKVRENLLTVQLHFIEDKKIYSSDLSILEKVFDPFTLSELIKISKIISKIENPYRDLFFVALLRVSEKFIGASKAGGFLRIGNLNAKKHGRLNPPTSKMVENLFFTFSSEVEKLFQSQKDIVYLDSEISLYEGDARDLNFLPNKYDLIVTSPPYPNRQDYTRVFASELALVFSTESTKHKDLRYKTLRSHLEAKPQVFEIKEYDAPKSIQEAIDSINVNYDLANPKNALKKVRKIDVRISKMINGYFEDIFLFLKSLKLKLKPRAYVCLVVANVRHQGISIEVDTIIAEIAEKIGFTCQEIVFARNKGNSAQQMRDYERTSSRESIIILRLI